MELLLPLGEFAPFLVALLIAGAVAGFLAGLFGIGGGAVLVPVFYQMLTTLGVPDSVCTHIAVGTSLAIIVPTSLRSFHGHFQRGAVDTQLLRSFAFAVPAGVVVASIITAWISGQGLRLIFAVIVSLLAIKLILGKNDWRLGTHIPPNPLRSAVGFIIGFLSTFMGIGGGVFNNTFMALYGRPMLQAVATSAGVGVLISIPGVLGYVWAGWGAEGLPPFSLGFVNLVMVAVTVPLTLLVAPLGVKLAHRLPKRWLEISFGIFLIIVAIRFFASL